MVEAARTTASPAAIWAICAVAVACLAFWLVAIAIADRRPFVRHGQTPDMPGPVLGGMHIAGGGRSVAPNRDAPAVPGEPLPEVPAQRTGEPEPAGAPATAGRSVPGQQAVATEQPAAAPGPGTRLETGRDVRSGFRGREVH